jgi:hypothetical protein
LVDESIILSEYRYPHVPVAIDLVSSDDYGDMAEVKNTRWFYNKFLYPKYGSDSIPLVTDTCFPPQ